MSRKSMLLIGLLLLVLFSSFLAAQRTKASETIYIHTDGSVNPPDAPLSNVNNVTYRLESDVSDSIVIQRNNILLTGNGCTVQGSDLWDSKGIVLTNSQNVTIQNITVRDFWFGVYFNYTFRSSVLQCDLQSNHRAIEIHFSSENSIKESNITDNASAISLRNNSTNNDIIENVLAMNSWDGIQILESSYNIIFGNDIDNNSNRGILLRENSSGNTIFENNIEKNYEGIRLEESSSNAIYGNTFLNNTRQVYDIAWIQPSAYPSLNTWDNGSIGNLWSDYTHRYPNATEKDNSNIWDTPYVIDENNQDNYPIIPELPSITYISISVILMTIPLVAAKKLGDNASKKL